MDETKAPTADPGAKPPEAPEATIPPPGALKDGEAPRHPKAGKPISKVEADRNDRVMVNVSAAAKKALAEAGYTLEGIAMAPDAELAALKGVSGDAVRAIRQRVPYRNGSNS